MQQQDSKAHSFDEAVGQEWIVTNGLGGYASSTIAGCNTRKYHGLLVAAMSPPVRRMVILSRVEETLIHRGWPHPLASVEYPDTISPEGHLLLRAFNHDAYPRWGYQGEGWTLVKHLHLLKGSNTVLLRYILLGSGDDVQLEVRPLFALRGIHELMYQWSGRSPAEPHADGLVRIPPTRHTPEAFFAHDGAFANEPYWYFNTIYRHEKERGYRGLEDLWLPGTLRWTLRPGQYVNFAVSTDPINLAEVIQQAEVHDVAPAAIVPPLSSDEAVIDILERAADCFRLDLPDDSPVPAVASHYHWGAPNVRDTLIGLAGLHLVPGRFDDARKLLLALADHALHGLVPTAYSEERGEPLYTAADTSLWFIHAVHDYLRYTQDRETVLQQLLPTVERIIAACVDGIDFGIRLRADGLLETCAGATWMNTCIAGTPINPRQGCAVEINALWYSALHITAELLAAAGQSAAAEVLVVRANAARIAFNRLFWNDAAGCCFDVVSDAGADPAIRPNQVLAISLPYPLLDAPRHEKALSTLHDRLLTPFGLRTLAPGEAGFVAHKTGDAAARDRARHNGAAYPWLLGPYTTALARVGNRSSHMRDEIRRLLKPCVELLAQRGDGQLPELFDAMPPHTPGGAIASAVNVAELLRAYSEEVLGRRPALAPTIPNALGDAPLPPVDHPAVSHRTPAH